MPCRDDNDGDRDERKESGCTTKDERVAIASSCVTNKTKLEGRREMLPRVQILSKMAQACRLKSNTNRVVTKLASRVHFLRKQAHK